MTSEFSVQKEAARGSRTVLAGMAPNPIRAITIDALGTLLELLPPAPRLRAGLRERFGLAVSDAEATRAMRAEIGFYRAHLHLGRDQAGLAALRRPCAEVLRDTLPRPGLDLDALTEVLLDAIRFEPFPDAVPALQELRAAGVRLVAASNWDVSLHEQLERTGLRAAARRRGVLRRGRRGQAGPGDPRARAGDRGRRAGGRVARRRRSRGRRRRRPGGGVRPVLIDREGGIDAPAGVLGSPHSASCRRSVRRVNAQR